MLIMEKKLGKNLLYLRRLKGWNLSEIKDRLDINLSTWGNYENDVSQPNLDVLMKISKFFGISESDLLHEDLKEKGNLNINSDDEKFKENSNLNRNVKSNLIPENEEFKTHRKTVETAFNYVLNEDQALYSIHEKLEDLYSKIADLANKVSQMEANNPTNAPGKSKK